MMRRWTFVVRWSNPYTQPPGGQARERLRVTVEQPSSRPIPPAVLDAAGPPGNGYGIHILVDVPAQPTRQWSKETKARVRKKKMRERLEKKAPLFADQFFIQEVAARGRYYDGEDVAEIRQALQE